MKITVLDVPNYILHSYSNRLYVSEDEKPQNFHKYFVKSLATGAGFAPADEGSDPFRTLMCEKGQTPALHCLKNKDSFPFIITIEQVAAVDLVRKKQF